MTMPTTHSIPDPCLQPRQFLDYLYQAAVERALPLANTARFLPRRPRPRAAAARS